MWFYNGVINLILNIFSIGFRDALFWDAISPGKAATLEAVGAQIRCCDRLMARSMMVGKPEAYAIQGSKRERLASILNKLEPK